MRLSLPAATMPREIQPRDFKPGFQAMSRTIRLQSDSNAHDRPWRVAVEQGFFAAEGLEIEYHEDNPQGTAGRVEDFSQRWKESQLRKGALEVYPVSEWGAIERVQALGGGKIIGLDTTVRTGALMVRQQSAIQSLPELRNVPIAVTWHAGTFYAAIEALEAAGVPFAEIKLVHANDRLDAAYQRHARSRGADGATGQPRACSRRTQARRLALARRNCRQ